MTSGRGFALADDLVSRLKNVQIQYRLAVSLGSFIRQARGCMTSDRGFALADDLVSRLKIVQIQYRLAVSLGTFIRQQ